MLLEKLIKEFDVDKGVFTQREYDLFDGYFERIEVQRNAFLIEQGQVERYSYFISDGAFRCWTLNHKGDEQTFWFCLAGTFSMSNISFTLEEQSLFNVQAVMSSVVYRIDKEQVVRLYTELPLVKEVFSDLTAKLLNRLLKRNIDLIKYTSEQYYLELLNEYGELMNYLPLKDIASFIGVTPQGLSRIRKRIF
ncbi:Crp/Fnr family transcriptional regulator [Myroides albus]|uniref:Cyclic nucleotide-binding domain-containing protein n=1 Tax=Myroides albus TaxID=2562892 RepID=A0A6I3LS25_9FLAO|nr:Crp/Fnr family transcriptional regulator [Myroides albus]MTG99501.1 cyclic nucleotide-binding domain-containing protein [Myroides albus]UVD79363.1 Crp/Fnr family transcriptional regulator [Myroides albus]